MESKDDLIAFMDDMRIRPEVEQCSRLPQAPTQTPVRMDYDVLRSAAREWNPFEDDVEAMFMREWFSRTPLPLSVFTASGHGIRSGVYALYYTGSKWHGS